VKEPGDSACRPLAAGRSVDVVPGPVPHVTRAVISRLCAMRAGMSMHAATCFEVLVTGGGRGGPIRRTTRSDSNRKSKSSRWEGWELAGEANGKDSSKTTCREINKWF
jgi:hypothetical protein